MVCPIVTRDELSIRVRELRKTAGITQKQAAKHAGVAPLTWSSWENNRHQPHAYRIGDIARAIGVPVAALFTTDNTHAIADIVLTSTALERIEANGTPELQALTVRIATGLTPVLASAAEAHATSQGLRPIARRARPRPVRAKRSRPHASADDSNTS